MVYFSVRYQVHHVDLEPRKAISILILFVVNQSQEDNLIEHTETAFWQLIAVL